MIENTNDHNKTFFDILVLADTDIENKNHIQYLDDDTNYSNLKDVFNEKNFCDYYDYAINNKLSWALYGFGWMFHAGRGGVKKNYEKAIELYKICITKNNACAMNNLAFMYKNGKGVDIDYEKAIELYDKSIRQGNEHATINLIYLYELVYINCTHEMAFKLYNIGAQKNHEIAINYLANSYLCGRGIKQDITKAFKLYKSNAKQGNQKAINKLANIYDGNLSHDDYKLDLALCLFGINKGHKKASAKLAFMYIHGHGFEMDYLVGYDMLHLTEDIVNLRYMRTTHGDTLQQLHKNRKTCIQYVLWLTLNKDTCDIISTYVNAF